MAGFEELSLDNFIVDDNIDLFGFSEEPKDEDTPPANEEGKENENQEKTTEVDTEHLFDTQEKPKSVGSEEEHTEEEDTSSAKEATSPNFYSSCAKAFVEEGVYSLSDDELAEVKDAESFLAMAKNQAEKQLTEVQKRVNDALNAGVEVSEIQKYEKGISQLESITEEQLKAETQQGKQLRQWVIYNDYLSSGMSEDRAKKLTEQTLKAGNDIEDASDSLKNVISNYKGEYNKLIEDAKAEEKKYQDTLKAQAENLKKGMLEGDKVFGDITVAPDMRKKAYDAVTKVVYTDPETGDKLTEIQQFQREHPDEYLKAMGFFYALSNGFKDVNRLVKSKVQKEMKKGVRELEHVLNNTARTSSGSINFASGVDDGESSIFGEGVHLAF